MENTKKCILLYINIYIYINVLTFFHWFGLKVFCFKSGVLIITVSEVLVGIL